MKLSALVSVVLCLAAAGLDAGAQSASVVKPEGVAATGPLAPVNFGTVNVGTLSAARTVTFTFTGSGSIIGPQVWTEGVLGLDFTSVSGGTCITDGTRVYNSGDTCTVAVTFQPTVPGMRFASVLIFDSTSDKAIAFAKVEGRGLGPMVTFPPGVESEIGSGFSYPGQLVVDGAGDVFIEVGDTIYEEVWTRGALSITYSQKAILTIPSAGGIAIDGSGALYIAAGTEVRKEQLNNGVYIETIIGSGMNLPNSIALDTAGNLFVADDYNGRVLKEMLQADGSYVQTDIYDCGRVGGQSCPSAAVVDTAGNLYVTAYNGANSDRITVLKPNGAGVYAVTGYIGSGLNWPSDIKIDRVGNLYLADTLGNQVVKETLVAGAYVQSVVGTSSVYWPWGVAVDGRGDVYVADTYHNRVLMEDLTVSPGLFFKGTAVGTTSSDSPLAALVENDGNAALTFPALTSGSNPMISGDFTLGSGDAADCPVVTAGGTAATLAAGTTCSLAVSYKPTQSGVSRGTIVLTDNDRNITTPSYATQTIHLGGRRDDRDSIGHRVQCKRDDVALCAR